MLMGIHDDKSIYSRDWGWVNEGAIIDEIQTWENKTIDRIAVRRELVGWIKENFPRPKRRNRTW